MIHWGVLGMCQTSTDWMKHLEGCSQGDDGVVNWSYDPSRCRNTHSKVPSEKFLSAPNIHVGTFPDRVALTRWKPKLKAGMLIFYLEFWCFLNFLDIFPSISFNSNALENPTVVFKSFLGGREKFSRLQPGSCWGNDDCGSQPPPLTCVSRFLRVDDSSEPSLPACLDSPEPFISSGFLIQLDSDSRTLIDSSEVDSFQVNFRWISGAS